MGLIHKVFTDSRLKGALQALAWVACYTFLFVLLAKIVSGPRSWYSSDIHFRMQTEAFLEGRLAIWPHPYHAWHDWSFGLHGVYQIWSLGVPLLRLPFEFVAKNLGFVGFPDRMVLAMLFAVASLVTLTAISNALRRFSSCKDSQIIRLEAAALALLVVLQPPLIALIRTWFRAYEEAAAFQALWGLLLFGLLLHFYLNPRRTTWLVLCVCSAFAPFIRVTSVFNATIAVAFGFLIGAKKRIGYTWLTFGVTLFALGPSTVLLLNHIRFGHPFEFGYRLNSGRSVPDEFALRFGYPFQNESFFSAARELFGSMFLMENFNRLSDRAAGCI